MLHLRNRPWLSPSRRAVLVLAALPWLPSLAVRAQSAPVTGANVAAPAAATGSAADPAGSWLQQLKPPAPWLTWGADFRARNEYYNNIVTLAETSLHEQDLFRFRWRVWGSAVVAPDLTFNTRLSGESRYWEKPAFVGAFKGRTGLEERFGIFDTLALKWANVGGAPVTLTVGRQDLMLGDPGDWWLVMDGTPNDGSWTTYFDSIRLTVDAKSIRTKFDVIGLVEPMQPAEWLPTLGDSGSYPVTDQKEQGIILSAANKSLPGTEVDGYFIYKHDQQQTATVAGATRLSGDNADICTVGGKLTGTPAPHWLYSLEGAYQFGTKADRIAGIFARRDVRAYGGKAKLTYAFKDVRKNQLSLSGEVLSGDDPATPGTDEMFDVLWGRWPRWSELYIYSYIYETGGRIAQMNNLGRIGGEWSIAPVKGTTASLAYHALFALEDTPTRAVVPTLFSNDGHFRGHYVQAVLKHQFNAHLSGHVWAEWVWEGNYYAHRELLTFLRAELAIGF